MYRLTIMNDSSYDDEIKDYADFSSSLKKYIDVKVNGNRWDVIVVPLVFLCKYLNILFFNLILILCLTL